ncbi:MAG: glycine--tRNA ligase subunit beta [Magnetospirillum sp.]|nr:glycine--tRNA ligase subunit beta [Magnetospirillum sp.]
MAELLLEILSEEIPARMQGRAAEELKRLVCEGLGKAGLEFSKSEAFVTPRRLALVVDGLPLRTPDLKEEKKGPRVGSPDQAIAGFLKGAGLASLDACEKRMVGKAEFWFAVVDKKGAATSEILPGVIVEAIKALPWPKSMRAGTQRFAWVRPMQGIVALLDGTSLSGEFDLGGDKIAFGNTTVGHRFLAPAAFAVSGFADYRAKLEKAFVILDAAARRAKISADASAAAAKLGVKLRDDPGLLDEVAGLVEWPVVLAGAIDEKFMDVPAEVLVTSMRAHQKYFATLNADGSLGRHFIVVANMVAEDNGELIVAGNERVLRARLSDAKFFWDQDRKTKLEARVPALASRVFHAKLGKVLQKVERLEKLSAFIAGKIGADVAAATRAAHLAKADLSSGMVGEFPELQGIMGRYYARHDGESELVANAIRAHYQPLGPGDACPSEPVSVAVALAEKIDTLAGFWSIDEKPTGSKDPFALRRSALGVIRLILENKIRLDLGSVFKWASISVMEQRMLAESVKNLDRVADAMKAAGMAESPYSTRSMGLDMQTRGSLSANRESFELLDFFADRLKVSLKEKGVRHDLIDAVFALGDEDDLVRLLARVEALGAFLASDDGANLLIAARRASNIAGIEAKKDGASYDAPVDAGLLAQAEETELFARLSEVEASVRKAVGVEDFAAAMRALASLRGPLDAFFDKVTVNADDAALRANRLKLLSQIRRTTMLVADFARIEG